MRTSPSTADLELIRRVRLEHGGIEVSPTQLERWRWRGLLPRVQVVRERFGGTSVPPHSDEVVGAAALLGRTSRRGRAWQLDAERLFNNGYQLTQAALQETAAHLVRNENAKMRAAWEIGKSKTPPDDDPSYDESGDFGWYAAGELPKSIERAVRKEIDLAHKDRGASKEDLKEYSHTALTWRIVDIVEPERLGETHQNLARHGVEEPMWPIGGMGMYPLPSERLIVAQSLTKVEVEVYRRFAEHRILNNPALGKKEFGLLAVTTWILAAERLKIRPNHLDLPLPQTQLDLAESYGIQ